MCWSELNFESDHKIRRAILDGSAAEDVYAGLELPCGLALGPDTQIGVPGVPPLGG